MDNIKRCINCGKIISFLNDARPLWPDTEYKLCYECKSIFGNIKKTDTREEAFNYLKAHGYTSPGIKYISDYYDYFDTTEAGMAIKLKKQYELKEAELKQKIDELYQERYIRIKEKNPVYILDDSADAISFVHIENDRSLYISSVSKISLNAICSKIPFEKIHYYEKAGAIHYVSNVSALFTNQSYAGCFVPSKVHLTPAIIGALLAGPMGLTFGIAAGYEGAHFTDASANELLFREHSGVHAIDERSVLLNYYSDEKKQYLDVEFPADMYNFLQTHYAEKKYDIVLASEKRKYVMDNNSLTVEQSNKKLIEKSNDNKNDFEVAVKRLKLMRDNDLISEDEFNQKKKELLSRI